jgi:F-type H+-transporting ATPase subunit delta
MSTIRIATRYAKSLFDLSTEKGSTDRILQDASNVTQAIAGSRDLQLMLQSPIVTTEKKFSVLQAIFGSSIDGLTMQFVKMLTDKRREAYLSDIMQAFQDQYRVKNRIVKVRVISASVLSDAALAAIRAKVGTEMPDTTIEIETSVDASLIGGFVLEFGDKRYDASIASQLNGLRKTFGAKTNATSL